MGSRAVRKGVPRPLHVQYGEAGAYRPHLYLLSAQWAWRDGNRRIFGPRATRRDGRDPAVLGRGREGRQARGVYGRDRAGALDEDQSGSLGGDGKAPSINRYSGAARDRDLAQE